MPRSMTLPPRAAVRRLCAGALLLVPAVALAQAPSPAPPGPAPSTQAPTAAPASAARRLTLDEALSLAEGGSEQVAAFSGVTLTAAEGGEELLAARGVGF